MRRVKIGDIIEIPTTKGFAYAQYTHKHKMYGALIRILEGLFDKRPEDFTHLVKKKHRYATFIALQSSVNQGFFTIVGNEPVPEEANKFPLFRAAGAIPREGGKVLNWWLWDGEKEWFIDQLKPEQRSLPIASVWTATLLIQRIESGWTPETDPFT